MRFALTVTGPAYGTQQASSAWQFAQAVLQEGHELACVFFYREGVLNANQLTAPASDEFDLVRGGNPSTMSTASRCISAWRPPCVVA
ncbi:tRNA 5-methylaminomethyl-2-thiouridine synthase TusD [Klebsiella pneumoniae subsp. ozaenae]|uniref:tRNA 5-methylaminomethyl-2-thiouridine synthase TusD n=1 Tax=Klebsiella pneumoniae subsp. ozaenae TaxID=574 RepID=A0A377YZV6_KLEPO|nr:tRNA 5-methylaminomethyl-2-thiouridine synthase TusD [Klebsiella pneumoniae subsp. ozaenae]